MRQGGCVSPTGCQAAQCPSGLPCQVGNNSLHSVVSVRSLGCHSVHLPKWVYSAKSCCPPLRAPMLRSYLCSATLLHILIPSTSILPPGPCSPQLLGTELAQCQTAPAQPSPERPNPESRPSLLFRVGHLNLTEPWACCPEGIWGGEEGGAFCV